ncbi:MAG: DNA translocase FtsK, partial [Candidatus Levybacteria bacterium CG_4_10_14_0_2_um_filter_35_8]
MAKRRPYRTRKPKLKLKLKKNTIYSLFSFGLILTGLILSLSFTRNGNSFIILNDTLISSFGFSAYIFPLGIILLGFLFLRLKIFLSKPNVALGFLLFFVSFAAVSRGGIIGGYLFQIIADVLMSTGAYLVYLFGMFVGLIVLFDTSMDKLFNGIIFIFSNLGRLFPSKFVDYFKKDKIPSLNNNRQMTIKGMDKNFPSAQNAREQQSTVPVKKDSPLIADKLVQNTLGKNVLWEYPPLSLLSDTTAQ